MARSKGMSIMAVVAIGLGAGCDVSTIQSDATTDSGGADTTPVDTSAPPNDGLDGLSFCDPRDPDAPPCPEGLFCETTSLICVECVGTTSRCDDGGGRETCPKPVSSGVLDLQGGFYERDPCPSGEVCVQRQTTIASCEPRVCDPGFVSCVDGQVLQCNTNGTEQALQACDHGLTCYSGRCQNVRDNVLFIFDTSGSMNDYADDSIPGTPSTCEANQTPCLDAFPGCDNSDPRLTRFGLSKRVFSDALREVKEENLADIAQFALQRFPQHESGSNTPRCDLGWYLPNAPEDSITGDDDSRETKPGDWFDQNRHEAIIVPFPIRSSLDNRQRLQEWLDNSETLGASDIPCQVHSDCGTGQCGSANGEGRCFYHDNEELRAGGETPLGKSLFYAGEYFRRFVLVDGKACEDSADCGSSGYVCAEGRCFDPHGHCKRNFVVLFTDGAESHHTTEAEFFNPSVQAKRLSMGLDCDTDADCRGGASCVTLSDASGQWRSCLSDELAAAPHLVPTTIDSEGFGALERLDGSPISIEISVMTLGGECTNSTANKRIADSGGGLCFPVSALNPGAFKNEFKKHMTPGTADVCTPRPIPGR